MIHFPFPCLILLPTCSVFIPQTLIVLDVCVVNEISWQ